MTRSRAAEGAEDRRPRSVRGIRSIEEKRVGGFTLSLRLVDRHGPRQDERDLLPTRLHLPTGQLHLELILRNQNIPLMTPRDHKPHHRQLDRRFPRRSRRDGLLVRAILLGRAGEFLGEPAGGVHEGDDFADGAVDELVVDVLDEHHLGVDAEGETGWGEHVGEELVALGDVDDGATWRRGEADETGVRRRLRKGG